MSDEMALVFFKIFEHMLSAPDDVEISRLFMSLLMPILVITMGDMYE